MNNFNNNENNQGSHIPPKRSRSTNFFSIIKNLFILLIFLQFAPIFFVNIKDYLKDAMVPKTEVGYLNITGILESSTFYVKKIEEYAKDPDIKALLIKVDCPGGLPGTSQAVFSAIKHFKKDKPVVVYTENVCASGAYYLACAANEIIANPSAMVGSIGVLMQLPNVKDLMENWKIKFKYIQTGKYKTAGSPLKDNTKEELDYLQDLANENYQQFIKDVAESRKLDLKDHLKWADGKVFLATTALKLKLIDQIGSRKEAIDSIKKLAKIDTEVKLIVPKQPSGLMKLFRSSSDDESLDTEYSTQIAQAMSNVYNKFIEIQESKANSIKVS